MQKGKIFVLRTCICSWISRLWCIHFISFSAFMLSHPSLSDIILNSWVHRNLGSQDSELDWNSNHLTDFGNWDCNSQFIWILNDHSIFCLCFYLLTHFLHSRSQSVFRSEAYGTPPADKHFPPTFWREWKSK